MVALLRSVALLAILLGGCAAAPSPPSSTNSSPAFDLPTASELLADYSPRHITLVEIHVNVTVPDDFDEAYSPQRYSSHYYSIQFQANETPALMGTVVPGIWLVQDNDTVVYGVYTLHSNKHAIREEYLSVNEDSQTGFAFLGGLDFRIIPETGHMASAFFGPYTMGSNSIDLPFRDKGPLTRWFWFNHTSTFPMTTGFDMAFEERPVAAKVELRYWGKANFILDAHELQSMGEDPAYLDRTIAQYASNFLPGGRVGQTSAFCGGAVLRAPAPCMMQWEHPQV